LVNNKIGEVIMPIKLKEGTLRKRTDGRWEARFTKNKIRYSVCGKTQKETITKLKIKIKELKQPYSSYQNYSNKNFEEWLKTWLSLYKIGKVAETTLYTINSAINKHIPKSLMKTPLKKLHTLQIQEVLNKVKGGRARETTANIFSDSLSKAYDSNIIINNPYKAVTFKKHIRKHKSALTKTQVKILLKEIKGLKIEDIVILILLTGMRRTEAVNIIKKDIDFKNNILHIKGTKTKGSDRKIPITEELKNHLKKISKKDIIFNFSPNIVSKHFSKLIKRIGWSNITLHSLRHTFATRCLEAGIQLKVISGWLGHSNIQTTANIYMHVLKEYEREEVKKLENML
jgi:integrase